MDTPGLTLLELLPGDGSLAAVGWQRRDFPVDAGLPEAISRCVQHRDTDATNLLAVAMVLVESQLTGSDAVMATLAGSGRTRQAVVEVSPTAESQACLKSALVALKNAKDDFSPAATWAALEGASALPGVEGRIPLAWQLSLSGHPCVLTAHFSAPVQGPGVDLLAACLLRVLAALTASTGDESVLVDVLNADERGRILDDWNATAVPRRASDTVAGLFAEIAARQPDAIAVADDRSALSYRQLDGRANALAARLRESGAGAGSIVGILLDRSADATVAMLAVLKIGAAYLPLDAAYPRERLEFMLRDTGAKLVVTANAAQALPMPAGVIGIVVNDEQSHAAPGIPELDGDALAYVMYTSGSTGEPKAVEIRQRSIICRVRDVSYVVLGPDTRFLHAAPLGFDASTLELWGPLLNGGRVVVHAETVPTAAGLAATIQAHAVTTAFLTTALFNVVVDENPRALAGLRQLFFGGEANSVPHVRCALDALPDTQIIHCYGPTECTTFSTTYVVPRDLDPQARTIPIGGPITDTTLYVLNRRKQAVPADVVGELYIGGAGLARAYRNRPELTAERFVDHPFCSGERLYRTGDLVRYRPDGNVEFVGRADRQVKVRGFRIELGEIEAVLSRHPDVSACAVLAREDRPGDKRLVAYYVPRSSEASRHAALAPELRKYLAESLPAFMVPALYMALDKMPVTVNGKRDLSALPVPGITRPELAVAYEPPINSEETRLCEAFAAVLDIERVGRLDSFFELGGNSLLALRVIARLRESDPARAIPATLIFHSPTPASLAAAIASGVADAVEASRLPKAYRSAEAPSRRSAAGRLAAADGAMANEPVAIIAMAGRFPGAKDVEQFWDNLCAGRESITMFGPDELDPSIAAAERLDPDYVPARGIIDGVEDFDAAFFGINPREAELMDPQHRIFLELCWECMERGGHVPDASAVPVGVFAGTYHSTYLRHHVAAHPDLVEKVGAFQVMLGNEKDFIATRVAHKLNLTGPAISLYTACSTSLVAICQALHSVRAGHCDMALAGGVAITCPPRSGYLHQDGTMLSPDGHTRAFDAQAQGTVFSDGAGVVLLKRLSDAIRDGNPVHAVILGGAVNNDGGGKASFTAPSSEGQAAVIAMAHADARVSPRSIGYVETHGTATPMGDPIEIEGLSRAFGQVDGHEPRCRIGSVKSNVGHMVIAAGAAGVIKTALALSQRRIPASLHYKEANPALGLADSQFVVNAELHPWLDTDMPLRAGVSAFGVGGTNAHVVLEEAPALPEPEVANGPSLLVLSARTPAALSQAAERLADFLQEDQPCGLADVAWTLAVGRKPFAHRIALVGDHAQEAIDQLRSPELAAAMRRSRPVRHCDPIFAFPGQGSHYAGMGRALYEAEPEFGAAIDECVDALRAGLGLDLRVLLFSDDPAVLLPTAIMQPAIFSIEYALARLWMSRGLKPSAMIGHSVGEFVAATIAEVFELRDALQLVAARGALMQAQPGGAMLSVKLPLAELLECLPAELSLAAENSFGNCVVSGGREEIARFQQRLQAEGRASRELHTSHAFHSAMMDPVVQPFLEKVAKVPRSPPKLRIVSGTTGAWLDAGTATSPEYWARHLREPVRFAGALSRLLDAPGQVLLESGPRATLSTLTRQHPEAQKQKTIAIASLGDSVASELASLRLAAGQLWCQGVAIDPASFDHRQRRRRVQLPTYPFERQRFWVDPAVAGVASVTQIAMPANQGAHAVAQAANEARVVAALEKAPEPASFEAAPAGGRRAALSRQLLDVFEDIAGFDLAEADEDSNFMELGLDSLMLTQVALQLQKTFKVKVSFRQLMGECATLARLVGMLEQQLPAEEGGQVQPQPPIQAQAALQPREATPGPSPSAGPAPDTEPEAMPTKYDVKKAFGAIARIDTSGSPELSERQRDKLNAYMQRYLARTVKSKQYTQEQRRHLADPRVVNGFRPLLKEIVYQIVIERSKGAHLWDLDGNCYVDALNGFGMSLFGWQPDFVLDAVRRQLESGYEIGPQHPLAGEVAKLLCDLTGHERAALCNTGSEAVLGALRIARTVTGRSTVVIFSGSYHGIIDEMIVRGGKNLRSMPAAPGILRNTAENVLVLDYGTPESLEIIRSRAHDIAAVLVEPVQSRRPDFQPQEFLQALRTVTRESGAVYIFDEIVTGFRSHPRGAQGLFGIQADLATYGKVIGGGFPIGVIAGSAQFMDALDGGYWNFGDDSMPTVGVTYFAGTFVRHPLALAAAKASLEHLREQGEWLQQGLNARTAAMAGELNQFCRQVAAPIEIRHFSSVWRTQFLEDHPLQDLLFGMMRSRGVHVLDNFPCFMTTAHVESDYRQIIDAFKESVLELQDAEFLPRRAPIAASAVASTSAVPAIAGARLGREPDGSPAWFVPNPEQPGKFLRLGS